MVHFHLMSRSLRRIDGRARLQPSRNCATSIDSGSAGASPSRLLGALLVLALAVCDSTSSGADLSFSRDVRPILAENCFKCHGHDEQQRKGKMRLDDPAVLTTPAKSGAIAIVPGNPEQSELVKRITASSPDDRMPPASSNKHLTPQQIETLKLWVAEGAKYEKHWAFVPPQRPEVPEVKDADWRRTPIDPFHSRPARIRTPQTLAQGGQNHAAATALPRPARPAADDRPSRCVSERRFSRRV